MGMIFDSSVLLASVQQQLDLPALYSANAEQPFYLATITAAELLRGVEMAKGAARRKGRSLFVDAILDNVETLDLDAPVARQLGALSALGGHNLKPADLIVAATALQHALVLVTMRPQLFGAVPRLKLADIRPFLLTNGEN